MKARLSSAHSHRICRRLPTAMAMSRCPDVEVMPSPTLEPRGRRWRKERRRVQLLGLPPCTDRSSALWHSPGTLAQWPRTARRYPGNCAVCLARSSEQGASCRANPSKAPASAGGSVGGFGYMVVLISAEGILISYLDLFSSGLLWPPPSRLTAERPSPQGRLLSAAAPFILPRGGRRAIVHDVRSFRP